MSDLFGIDDLNERYSTTITGLDLDMIQKWGQLLADAVIREMPVAIAYEPGNFTRYNLVIVPAPALARSPRHRAVPGIGVEVGWCVIAWIGHAAQPYDLGAFHAPWYVAEKFGCSEGDAVALTLLFRAASAPLAIPRALA